MVNERHRAESSDLHRERSIDHVKDFAPARCHVFEQGLELASVALTPPKPDTTASTTGGDVSCRPQPSTPYSYHGFQRSEFFFEIASPDGSQTIGLSPIGAAHRSNEPTLFESRDGP
jgi:hypothetical protein